MVAWLHAPGQERTRTKRVNASHTERERALCSPEVLTRSFFKITNELPEVLWASDGYSDPFPRLD